jgi:hypothetical protein
MLAHKCAGVLKKSLGSCYKIVDPAIYLSVHLLTGVTVILRHEAKTFVRIVNLARNFDQLLCIHLEDVE